MTEIVEGTMKSYKTDFYNYDKQEIEGEDAKFPMLWVVGENHTHLLLLGEFEDVFNSKENARYAYAQGHDYLTGYINMVRDERIYLITINGVEETTKKAAREIIRDTIIPVVEKWKAENGLLPTDFKLPIRFSNITLSELKELIRAEEGREGNTLIKALHGFRNYRRCSKDHYIEFGYNPWFNEFVFCEYVNGRQRLVGGVVFHGWPETGYKENYSCQLTPSYGWSTHT